MDEHHKPSLLERLSGLIMREPEDREQLIELLHSAYARNLLDSEALSMIEGVLQVSEMQVRDIMSPRAQMDVVDIGETPDIFIPTVISTAHSRFPVIDRERDNVLGILLAKDLLHYYAGEEEFEVREMLRPAVFVPESKRLNVLLREFRASRNHMAIVVDEYDFDEAADNIVRDNTGRFRVKATTEVADFNEAFGTAFSDEDFDTVGGMVIHHLGRLPKRNEVLTIGELRIQVLRADSRRVHTLLVDRQRALRQAGLAGGGRVLGGDRARRDGARLAVRGLLGGHPARLRWAGDDLGPQPIPDRAKR